MRASADAHDTTTDVSDFTRLPEDAVLAETVPMLEEHDSASRSRTISTRREGIAAAIDDGGRISPRGEEWTRSTSNRSIASATAVFCDPGMPYSLALTEPVISLAHTMCNVHLVVRELTSPASTVPTPLPE